MRENNNLSSFYAYSTIYLMEVINLWIMKD
nr:MAG TPA: hypothetical protein [Caudoviricetes sp.]